MHNDAHMEASSLCPPEGGYCLNPVYFAAESPRSHFDDLLFAFTTIFQVLSGENWNAVMYDCRRATGAVGLLYFLVLVILGLFIMMSLFLAILLSNFGDDEEE